MSPLDRIDAKRRADITRKEAEWWMGVVRERQAFADAFEGADKIAAQAMVQIAQLRVSFLEMVAAAYDRVAAGEPPFPDGRVLLETTPGSAATSQSTERVVANPHI